MPSYAFSGGQSKVDGYGDRWKIVFGGTYVFGDTWSIQVTSTEGDFTLGVGFLHGIEPTTCFTYRNREYLGLSSQFNFSDNGDVMAWEEQDPGAEFQTFLSNYGTQDTITALNQLQGRLVVFGKLSIQIWTVNADPNLFTLVQTLDNSGTEATLSPQNLGDYDVLYLDPTGIRSLKAKEVTLNADVDDVGLPIDSLVQALMTDFDVSGSCGIVEPTSKRYWLFVNNTIFVLSRYRSSKISAWATYLPTLEWPVPQIPNPPTFNGEGILAVFGLTIGAKYKFVAGNARGISDSGGATLDGDGYYTATDTTALIATIDEDLFNTDWTGSLTGTYTFTPLKFVIHERQVYCRTEENWLVVYGGVDDATYDRSVATVQLPWLDDKSPASFKQSQGIDVAMKGAWTLSAGTDPQSGILTVVFIDGSATAPDANTDSSFDKGRIPFESNGTHFQMKAVSSDESSQAATMSSIIYHYNKGEVQ